MRDILVRSNNAKFDERFYLSAYSAAGQLWLQMRYNDRMLHRKHACEMAYRAKACGLNVFPVSMAVKQSTEESCDT